MSLVVWQDRALWDRWHVKIGVLREVETGLLVGVRDGGVEAVPGGGNTAPGTRGTGFAEDKPEL